jgi:hypothetical protein
MRVVSAIAVSSAFLAARADASLIWDGNASKGIGVFGNLNCDAPGSVTAVKDAVHGTVWRYSKPKGSNRCENHGISVNGQRFVFQENATYHLGWWSKLSVIANDNANFQWESFGDHFIQNFPVLLKIVDGKMTLQYRQPGQNCCRVLWSKPIAANAWNHYALALHLSSSESQGFIEFWFNGVHQTLTNGSTRFMGRTLDTINEPKWGVYGASGVDFVNFVTGQRVGTTHADVDTSGVGAN